MLGSLVSRRFTRKVLGPAAIYLVLIILAVLFATPMLWMISTALKPDNQLAAWPPVWIPNPLMWENFTLAWNSGSGFGLYLQNTLVYSVVGTVGALFSAAMVAFGFSRLRFPGRDFLFGIVLATMMLPAIVTMIPTYVMFRYVNWLDTWNPLIVPSFFGGGAFFLFLLRQFFKTIPVELFEAARIDGASNYRIFAQVMLPLSKPALSTVAIFGFMGRWNDFMGPLIYLRTPEKWPMSLGIRQFISVGGLGRTMFQQMMAMSFLMTLPIVILFFSFQQYFVQGVVMTGIKG